MIPPRIVVRGLTIRAGGAAVVEDVSFDLHGGRALALVGESGSGKTVTALALLDLLGPGLVVDGGQITLDGRDLLADGGKAARAARGRRIAMVFQEPSTALSPSLSVGRHVADVIRRHRDGTRDEARREATSLLDRVGLGDLGPRFDDPPHRFSGGERQRVLLAMALAAEPSVLIADEPTSALDASWRREILQLLRELRAERGLAVLIVTHDLAGLDAAADDVAVLYAGRIVERAPAATFATTAIHPYSRALVAAMPTGDSRPAAPRGRVPEPGNRPGGCVFAPRCPLVEDSCRSAVPEEVIVEPGHVVACEPARTARTEGGT